MHFATTVVLSSALSQAANASDHAEILAIHCGACHRGKTAVAGFDLNRYPNDAAIAADPRKWTSAMNRIRNGEMPPKNARIPLPDEPRQQLIAWLDHTLHTAACADGITPAAAPVRRLNRNEYAATIRDLLNIHFNAGHALPPDGAGGEGFDNAAETLFLSPMHAEKYLDAAQQALDYAMKDPRARPVFLTAEPSPNTGGTSLTPQAAARKTIATFLPRAFRRPVTDRETASYLALFDRAFARDKSFESAILYALQGALLSPHFLFRNAGGNEHPAPRLVNDYEMASRLSYFLWGSMPDATLFQLASQGKLSADKQALSDQVKRMLNDAKTGDFAERFVEQWLNTRELGRDIKPDAKLFPQFYDAEIQSAIRYEPVLFFQEILSADLSLLNLIDSNFTILTNKLEKFYGLKTGAKLRQQPIRVELPPDSHRGGLMGMSAILAVSSLPRRTSPVLRGKWILDAMLGTPPPPAPPNVPELPDNHDGAALKSVRERLALHRQNPVCAGCHARIDPLGFSLDNYDVLGLWRDMDAGKPIDASGELPDGTRIDGAAGLKKILLERKDLFLRNLTTKMLGYALGRGLTLEDHCAVDQIVDTVKREDFKAQTLVREIVWSIPFRYQPAVAPKQAPARN